MGVPPEEHTIILYKIFEVLPAAAGGIETFTVREVDYHGTYIPWGQQNDVGTTITDELSSELDMLTLESFQTQWVRFVPATRSSVEKLQMVRLDSSEESTLKLNPLCSICRDDFAKGCVDQLVIPLPCAHYYHVDCIIRWQEVGHVCPLCRYALPTVPTEVDSEPSNS
ncbi:E3 ubiquitin-protein ligase RING1-like [Rosa chinensis]|uniref:E3 ubiquitin-protein ligase RING1-like n=1 Tax=Rosa chinensis TaxID=74649 RepID=UPI001AD8BC38|nr:E3 ubiquitin-protein ligase RING1-like [Rosa chinensis]